MSETKNFKQAINALVNVRIIANTSVYQRDIENDGEEVSSRIKESIKEYKNKVQRWDNYFETIPQVVYDIIDLVKNPKYNTFKDQKSLELIKKIRKLKSDIDAQIIDMTLEFVEENQ